MAIFKSERHGIHRRQTRLEVYDLNSDLVSYVQGSFTQDEIKSAQDSCYFLSGGTGFIGNWIVTLLSCLVVDGRKPSVTVISRNPEKAEALFQSHDNVSIINWDMLTFELNKQVIRNRNIVGFHAGVPAASGDGIEPHDIERFRRNTEIYANLLGSVFEYPVFVNVSSGGIYNRPISGQIPEDNSSVSKHMSSAYQSVKIIDENVVNELTSASVIRGVNPRLFSFTGPGLDIPGRFALGSFISDAISGKPVTIRGCPKSLRSYMSPIDMAIWIVKSSMYPTIETLHIGSSEAFSMYEIATIVSKKFGNGHVMVDESYNSHPEAYVPDTIKSQKLLNIGKTLDFERSMDIWRQQIKIY